MRPDDVFEYAKKLREAGIEEVRFERRLVGALADVGELDVTLVRLNPHWSPPDAPEAEPVFDADPIANGMAVNKWQEAKRLEAEMKRQAEEDRVRFAHTEGG